MWYALILLTFLVGGQDLKADSNTSRIAAVVNKSIISQSDLLNRLRFATLSSGLEPTAQNLEKMKPQILRILIDELLQLQIGQQYGIHIDSEHIQAAIQDIEEGNRMEPGSIAAMMKKHDIPPKTLENQIRAQLTWMIFIREKYPLKTLEEQVTKKRSEFAPSLQIADWEIDQEIKLQKEKETKRHYHLAEIVLPLDTPDQEAEVQNTLQQLFEELQKGAPFSALAQQFSQSATAGQGGDMGWLTEDQLEPEIKEALSQIQPGHLSAPVRTTQGYTLIAFLEHKLPGAESNALISLQQVLIPFPEDITEEKAHEMAAHTKTVISSAANCPALKKIAEDKLPGAKFHLVQGEPMSHFPGEMQPILSALAPQQLSEPLLTQDGILVMMVCDRKVQQTQEFSREEAIEVIAGRKHSLLAKRELRDLRRQAFIDIRG
jgi:peptidyl-prolyl cis-trans isomerase SurA